MEYMRQLLVANRYNATPFTHTHTCTYARQGIGWLVDGEERGREGGELEGEREREGGERGGKGKRGRGGTEREWERGREKEKEWGEREREKLRV